jgi:hypothetical protein
MLKSSRLLTQVLAGMGLASGIAAPAHAQSESEGGFRVGLLRVTPVLTLEAGYADNYTAAENDPQSSVVYQIGAMLDVASDWSRHEFNAHFEAPTTVYEDYSYTDYLIDLDGRVDVTRAFNFNGSLGYGDLAEPAGFADPTVTLDELNRYQRFDASIGASLSLDRFRVSADISSQEFDYDEMELAGGVIVDQDARDVTIWTYGARADLALTDKTSIFLSGSVNQRDHEVEPPSIPSSRDSEGVSYMAGVSFDLSAVWQGDISVGVFQQSYDDPALDDQDGLSASANVTWSPDELVNVTLALERSIQEANTVDAATVVGADANLDVVYEFRRNASLGLSVGYSDDEYVDIDRHDTRWSVTASGSYDVNPYASLTLSLGHNEQSSDGPDRGRNYDSNVGLIGIRLRR